MTQQKSKTLRKSLSKIARPGFEPGLKESESFVLPLHHRADDCLRILRFESEHAKSSLVGTV